MRTTALRRIAPIVAVLTCLIGGGPPAGATPFVTMRVSSLDTALADMEVVTTALKEEFDRDDLLAQIAADLGLEDLSFVDFRRPLLAHLPLEAAATMTTESGPAGVVLLPVTDVAATLLALEGASAEHTEQQGVHAFAGLGQAESLYVVPLEGYVAVTSQAAVLEVLDLPGILSIGPFPPGSVAIEIDLEAAAPLIQMGLLMGRSLIEQAVEAVDVPPQPDGENAGAGAGADEGAGAFAGDLGPQTLRGMLEFYFLMAQDALNNVGGYQLAFEVDGPHVILHQVARPRAGSTLEGLLAAQEGGGMPAIAAAIEPDAAIVALAGFALTPAAREAFESYTRDYLSVLEQTVAAVAPPAEGGGEAPSDAEDPPTAAEQILARLSPLADRSGECWPTEMALSVALEPAPPYVRATQLQRTEAIPACAELAEQQVTALEQALEDNAELREAMSLQRSVVIDGGQAHHVQLDMGALGGEQEAASALEGVTWDAYWSFRDGLTVATFGEQARERYARLVAAPTRGTPPAANLFAPVGVAPGLTARVDFSRVLEFVAAIAPEGNEPETEEVRALAKRLAGDAGTVLYGVHLGTDGLRIDAALPLELLTVLKEIEDQEDQEDHEPQAEPAAADIDA
jgi:hypothetical protein